MDTKQVILELRTQKGMSQDELAEKVFVSRQAVVEIKNDLIRTMEPLLPTTRRKNGALFYFRTNAGQRQHAAMHAIAGRVGLIYSNK